MLPNPHIKLCIVCSSSSGGEDVSGRGLRTGSSLCAHPGFSKFCGELELRCDDGDGIKIGDGFFKAYKFLDSLRDNRDNLFVCEKCLSLITEAMEKRTILGDSEQEVLQLQVELLMKMKVLQECTDLYYKEMHKIYDKVKDSEADCFEAMNGINGEGGDEIDKSWSKCNVLLFREKIFDVVTYLGMFRENLDAKIIRRHREKTHHQLDPPETTDLEDNVIDNDWDGFEDTIDNQSHEDLINETKQEILIYKKDEEANQDLISDNRQEDSDDEYVPPKIKRKRTHKSTSNPSGAGDPPPKRKRTKSKKATSSVTNLPSKVVPIKPSSTTNTKLKLLVEQIDFTGMGPLKKQFILRILRYKVQEVVGDGGAHNEIKNVEQLTIQDKWNYDSTTDKITHAGFEAELTEDKDKAILTIHCQTCGFNASGQMSQPSDANKLARFAKDIQEKFVNHILSTHLEAFFCKLCGVKTIKTLRSFKQHMEDCHRNPQTLNLKCQICGKDYTTKRSLDGHMKYVHSPDNAKMCQVCGKVLKGKAALFSHEQTHKSLEERIFVVCPFCGIKVVKKSYAPHRRTYCPMIKRKITKSVMCPICGKMFKDEYLNEHIQRKHKDGQEEKELEEFQCKLCGTSYKCKRDLYTHNLNVHNADKKQFSCGKGCGRKFLRLVLQQKHEEKCKMTRPTSSNQ